MNSKRAISPVVAIGLLLVVTISSVVAFQSWIDDYSSSMFSEVEMSSSFDIFGVEAIVGDNLYVKSGGDSQIVFLKIKDEFGNEMCSLNKIENSSKPYLLTHINFEERNSTHFFDVSGNNNSARINSGSFDVGSYVFGNYAIFDHGYDSLKIDNLMTSNFPQEKGTLMFFLQTVNCTYAYNAEIVITRYLQNSISIQCKPSGGNYFAIYLYNNSAQLQSTTQWYEPNWDLITISFDTTIDKWYVYRNNQLKTNANILDSSWTPSTQSLLFGMSNGQAFKGSLDEIRVFNTTLSGKEIENIFYFNADEDKINLVSGINSIPVLGCDLQEGQIYEVIAFTDTNKFEGKLRKQ